MSISVWKLKSRAVLEGLSPARPAQLTSPWLMPSWGQPAVIASSLQLQMPASLVSSMHRELPAEVASRNILFWNRLCFRHYQAEAASHSLPVTHMVGQPPAAWS